ncbi:amino acid/polyamine transporter I, partial [Thamnocephalis sphaerospora]
LGALSGTNIVIGMIVGSGIFSTPGLVWQQVGSPGMALIMWLVGGLLSYLGALCYVELGTMLPKSGGEQAYLSYCYKRSRQFFAFLFCCCIQPSGGAANSIVFGGYVLYAAYGSRDTLPQGMVKDHYEWIMRGIGLLSITIITLVCIFSTKWSLRLQNAVTSIKLVVLLVVAVTGVVVLAGGTPHVPSAGNWERMFAGTKTDMSTYASAMFNVFWAYGGWNTLNYCAGELKNPRRDLPIATFGGITIVSLLYLLANIAYIAVVPEEMAFSSREILAGNFTNLVFGLYVGRVVLPMLIALSTFGSVCAALFCASRVVHVAAQEGYFPFARVFGRIHPRWGTPVNALLFNYAAIVLLMFASPPGVVFDFLVNMAGYPMSIFCGLTVGGLLLLRRTEPRKERPFRVWWPVAAFFLIFSVFLAVFPFVPPEEQDLTTPYYLPALLGLFFMLAGIPMWHI